MSVLYLNWWPEAFYSAVVEVLRKSSYVTGHSAGIGCLNANSYGNVFIKIKNRFYLVELAVQIGIISTYLLFPVSSDFPILALLLDTRWRLSPFYHWIQLNFIIWNGREQKQRMEVVITKIKILTAGCQKLLSHY